MKCKHRAFAASLLICVGWIAAVAVTPFSPAREATDTSNRADQQHESTVTETKESHTESDHEVPFSPILLEMAFIIGIAVLGRFLAERFHQSPVLGELLIGVVVGNIGFWLGIPLFVMVMHLGEAMPLFSEVWLTGRSVAEAASEIFSAAELTEGGSASRLVEIMTGSDGPRYVAMAFALWLFSELGVILLLFMVGLETQIDEMLKVGGRAFAVAIVGVVTPFLLGLLTGMWLLPDAGSTVHIFLAATLCATSVGITARVFRDLGRLQTREAKIILGAAVIDDVLGLIILAVVVGIASTGQIDAVEIGRISLLSVLFLGSVVLFGGRLVGWLIPFVTTLEKHNVKLLFPLGLAFLMAWAANAIELAPIVGAFAAGLILSEEHFAKVSPHSTMESLIAPLERIFAPIFFVLMGMQVNLQSFLNPTTLWLAFAFSVVAIIGKLVCGLLAGRGVDRLSIGLGMIPRGEVGLIFASIGKGLGVISGSVFSALVVMVIVTTLITPIALKWSLFRQKCAPTP
jgi:Kef-type K+ transport system membrane component KefB